VNLRKLPYLMSYPVLGVTGFWVFVYLYRWSWNRAMIAGLFFLAIEIALIATTILDRLRKIEDRLGRIEDGEEPLENAQEIVRVAFTPKDRFAWLRESGDRLSVFVPVLLGLGVVMAALAWVVERVALATARPGVESRVAARLSALALPEDLAARRIAYANRRAARQGIGLVIVAIATAVGIDELGDLTQTRVDPSPVVGSQTTITLHVEAKDPRPATHLQAVENIWASCQGTGSLRLAETPRALGGGRFSLVLSPAVGTYAERQLHGCLEDARLNYVQAQVLDVRSTGP